MVPNVDTDGILISTDDVSIDLAGFESSGPVVCNGGTEICPEAGTRSGVRVTDISVSGVWVRNGSIRGMGFLGVNLGVHSEVTKMRVRSNPFGGISVSHGSIVAGNAVYQNGSAGISAQSGCAVVGNAVRLNGGVFLSLGADAGYRENVISGNAGGTVVGGVNAGENVCNRSLTCP